MHKIKWRVSKWPKTGLWGRQSNLALSLGKEHMTNRTRKAKKKWVDTEPALKEAVAKEFNLDITDPAVDSLLEAVTHFLNKGYVEGTELAKRFGSSQDKDGHPLLCIWCGGTHWSEECVDEYNRHMKEKK